MAYKNNHHYTNATPESPALADLRINLRAASVQTLMEQCILSFSDENEDNEPTSALPSALFLVHKWYLSSCDLGRIMLQLSRHRLLLVPSACRTVRYWIHLFPEHFDDNPELCQIVEEIRQEALHEGHAEMAKLLDTTCIPSYAWLRNISVRNTASRQFSLSFEQWTPDDIATNLTHIEFKLLRRITFAEYKQYATNGKLRSAPTLQRSIAVFNSLSRWVQCMVLNKISAKERAEVVTKFVHVAKRLKKLQNFNTFMAVVGGLTHSSLARLCKTKSCLSQETKRDLNEYSDLLTSDGNFTAYRKCLSECKGFRIPIIGVHLKDLISLHVAAPDYTSEGLLNCRKLAQLAIIFTHLMMDIQKGNNLPEANTDLIHTLKVSLDMPYSEDEIYGLSLKREPRTLLHSDAPRSAVFADWATGVCNSLDPQVMKKHVTAMVETVFKHYDDDKDGYISKVEFEAIAGNFPFIDPFDTLDTDNDGRISKQELLQYFILLNRTARVECRHNFRETTFLAPAFCFHCKRVLWGILRQGMKCQDCGLPIHRNCKEAITAECGMRRRQQLGRSSSFAEPSSDLDNNVGKEKRQISGSLRRPLLSFGGWHKVRTKRTVSTISPVHTASPPDSANRLTLNSSSEKPRCWSETIDSLRTPSPASEHVPSLASEEVFEIDEPTTIVAHEKTRSD